MDLKLKSSKMTGNQTTFKTKVENQGVSTAESYECNFLYFTNSYEYHFNGLERVLDIKELPFKNQEIHYFLTKGGELVDVLNLFDKKEIKEIIVSYAVIDENQAVKLNNFIKGIDNYVVCRGEKNIPLSEFSKLVSSNPKIVRTHIKSFLINQGDDFYIINTTLNPKKSTSSSETLTITNDRDYYNYLSKIIKSL